MSPSWNNRLRIAISPERISLLRLGRGLKPKLLAKHDEVIDASGRQPAWRAVVERLDAILTQPEWQNAEVDIVLSNRLVCYAAIPFDARLKDYSAQEAFARYSLTQTYGPVAGQWELRIQRGNAGKPWLVGATDKALLAQLRQTCANYRLKLRSVTPHLMAVFNLHSRAIKTEPVWLVIHEAGYSFFALLRGREFVAVSGVYHDNVQDISLLLDRENLTSPLDEPCKSVYLHAAFGGDVSGMSESGYDLVVLNSSEPDAAPSFIESLHPSVMSRLDRARLQLDFQQAVDAPRRLAGWALLLTGLVLLAEMGFSYDKLQQDREEMYRQMRASKLRLDMPREIPDVRKFTDEDFEKGRQIIGRLSTPWDELFAGLESVSNENAAILSIEPDMQTGLLRIEGEAKDYASVLTLIAQLRTTKPFSGVFLLRHETKRDDPLHPVGFTLSMRWVKP
ncbi:MAG: hypothetical protein WA056_05325 [Gallionella sp.]